MEFALALLSVMMTPPAFADATPPTTSPPPGYTVQEIFQISSDRDPSVAHANVMLDSTNSPAGVLVTTAASSDTAEPLFGTDATFWLADIEKPAGVLLAQSGGYNVLYLQGTLDAGGQSGTFHLKFLTNGFLGSYQTCDFFLKKNGAAWFGQNAYDGTPLGPIKVTTWALGVNTLEGICPN